MRQKGKRLIETYLIAYFHVLVLFIFYLLVFIHLMTLLLVKYLFLPFLFCKLGWELVDVASVGPRPLCGVGQPTQRFCVRDGCWSEYD